jgi:hypothetical protein
MLFGIGLSARASHFSHFANGTANSNAVASVVSPLRSRRERNSVPVNAPR